MIKIPENVVQQFSHKIKDIEKRSTFPENIEVLYNSLEPVTSFLRPFYPCHKGCAHCCRNDVLITVFEAMYISYKTKRLLYTDNEYSKKNRSSCPFLCDDICSIYEYRPLICRTYSVEGSSELCRDPRTYAPLSGTHDGCYSNVIFFQCAQWIEKMNRENFRGSKKDIRDFFIKH